MTMNNRPTCPPLTAAELRLSPVYTGLRVTRSGIVFDASGEEPRRWLNNSGYWYVSAYIGGKRKRIAVHRLVASAWCSGYSPGLQVNHKNGIKTDNDAGNLEWVTGSANKRHAVTSGLTRPVFVAGERHLMAKVSAEDVRLIRQRLREGETCSGLAREFGVSNVQVSRIKTGQAWKSTLDRAEDALPAGIRGGGKLPHNTKLAASDVALIREKLASGVSNRILARQFCVSDTTICDIKHGRSWRHLHTSNSRD